jgi:hypothetical protein
MPDQRHGEHELTERRERCLARGNIQSTHTPI